MRLRYGFKEKLEEVEERLRKLEKLVEKKATKEEKKMLYGKRN
jgi:hypothetical protein